MSGNAHGSFDLLVDWTNMPVMTQPAAQQAQRVISWCNDKGLRKAANVVATVTQRMQVKRVSAQNDRFQYFETRADAQAWLRQWIEGYWPPAPIALFNQCQRINRLDRSITNPHLTAM
ncbi:MAG: hypothetical protein ABJP48_12655 [Erythrobacter sp.]